MGKTLIFTATYNEKENIKKLIYDINKLNKNIDILVIDDNSPDKTCLLYTSPSPRDPKTSRMPSSA